MIVVDLNNVQNEADRSGCLIFELYPFKSCLSKLGQVKQKPHASPTEWQLVLPCVGPAGASLTAGAPLLASPHLDTAAYRGSISEVAHPRSTRGAAVPFTRWPPHEARVMITALQGQTH